MPAVAAPSQTSTMVLPPQQARQLYDDVIDGWPSDTPFNADRVLIDHPELRIHKSVVIDLAFEEYTRRLESGEDLAPTDFAARFETVQKSLVGLLQVNRFLHDQWLLPPVAKIAWPSVGDRFLNFQLTGELGRGAFSRVFLAQDTDLGERSIALKVCVGGGQEAQVLGKLDHPQIVPVHSVQRDDETGLTGICMPFLSRTTLMDVLDVVSSSGPPERAATILAVVDHEISGGPEITAPNSKNTTKLRGSYTDGVVQIGIEIADALAFSHSKGICHGDIKPSNVLLLAGGRAMLFDFNLSFDAEIDSQRVGGTLPYMAPEQLVALAGDDEGNAAERDARTDLFSLGATLYEMLTGKLPFGELPIEQPRRKIVRELLDRQEQGATPIRELNPQVDERLAMVIERCLAFDPAARWDSAEQLAVALRRHQSALQRARRWMAKNRQSILFTLTVLFATATAFGAFVALREPEHAREVRMGWAAIDQQDYKSAIDHFERALELVPDDLDMQFARGRAHMLWGNIAEARIEFEALREQSEDPRITASLAYCWAVERRFFNARQLFEDVEGQQVQGAKLDAVAIENNIGYCWLQQRRLDLAGERFEQALAADPEPNQIVQYNMAMLDYHTTLRQPREWTMPNTRFIDTAIGLGPNSPEMHFDAAVIYGLCAKRSLPASTGIAPTTRQLVECEEMTAKCEAAAGKAIDLGLRPSRLVKLDRYLPKPSVEIESLKQRPEPARFPAATPHMMDPLRKAKWPFIMRRHR